MRYTHCYYCTDNLEDPEEVFCRCCFWGALRTETELREEIFHLKKELADMAVRCLTQPKSEFQIELQRKLAPEAP